MVASTKRTRRSHSAGNWGRNRVRAFSDPRTGIIQIEWREEGRRRTRSLGHRDWARAKGQADQFAAGFFRAQLLDGADTHAGPLAAEALVDTSGEEVKPTAGELSRRDDGDAVTRFLRAFGRSRDAGTSATPSLALRPLGIQRSKTT